MDLMKHSGKLNEYNKHLNTGSLPIGQCLLFLITTALIDHLYITLSQQEWRRPDYLAPMVHRKLHCSLDCLLISPHLFEIWQLGRSVMLWCYSVKVRQVRGKEMLTFKVTLLFWRRCLLRKDANPICYFLTHTHKERSTEVFRQSSYLEYSAVWLCKPVVNFCF